MEVARAAATSSEAAAADQLEVTRQLETRLAATMEARQAAEKQGESLRQEGTARGVTFGEMSFREIVFADMPS